MSNVNASHVSRQEWTAKGIRWADDYAAAERAQFVANDNRFLAALDDADPLILWRLDTAQRNERFATLVHRRAQP
jgi:hypothetical protein